VTPLGGYLREEILGESFTRFYADPDERRQFVRTILAQGSVADYELRFLDKSGRERQLSANAVLTGEDGDLRIAGLLRDIGDRKAMETGLAEARRRADKASQAKSEFLARMSHELRTPLSGILGVTDLLLSMIADEEQRHLLGLLRETNELMMAVVGDLLDLSRIEAGHLELAPEPVDVRALALSILAMFSHHVQGRDLELDFRFDEGLPPHLVVDPVRLRQVLVNLVGNAVKYTSAGSVLLEITDLGPSGDAARNVEFRVADTGCGVPEAMRERIFDSYARLPENSTDAPGTGLGLTIVRELVELMGSTVKVTDRDPRGSVFSFCLALEPAGPSRREQSGTPPELAPLNLLLAEDDRINQFFTRKLLERMGHRVDVAGTGVEALEYLAAGSYDCVLMDIQMPDMDGVEATRRIRSGELSGVDPGVPVVAVTAFALEEDSRRFLEAGMNASIPKPLDVNALVRTLKRSITSNIEENH
jgi:signal transduction histidine kinase/CheY-like chemotaxis protein